MFLRNAWYVAGWDSEVTRQLRPLQILGDRLVLYRTGPGTPVALAKSSLGGGNASRAENTNWPPGEDCQAPTMK